MSILNAMRSRNQAREQGILARGQQTANTVETAGRSIMDAIGTYANYQASEPYRKQAQSYAEGQAYQIERARQVDTILSQNPPDRVQALMDAGMANEAREIAEIEDVLQRRNDSNLDESRKGLAAFGSMLTEFKPEFDTLYDHPDRYPQVYEGIMSYVESAQLDRGQLKRIPTPETFAGMEPDKRAAALDALGGALETETRKAMSASEATNWAELIYNTVDGSSPEQAVQLVERMAKDGLLAEDNPVYRMAVRTLAMPGGAERFKRIAGIEDKPQQGQTGFPYQLHNLGDAGGVMRFNRRTGEMVPVDLPAGGEENGAAAATGGRNMASGLGITPEQGRANAVVDRMGAVISETQALFTTADAEGGSVPKTDLINQNRKLQVEASKLGFAPNSLEPGQPAWIRKWTGEVERIDSLTASDIKRIRSEINHGVSTILPPDYARSLRRNYMTGLSSEQ